MSKNIVFCADGTWNGPGEADTDDQNATASNVFKLFLSVSGVDAPDTAQLAKEQERTLRAADLSVVQVSKYLHGVGDSANFLAKLIGGGVGAGLITRIVRGYTFVSRNYIAGDRIYLVGFSRGAYTARALAGLIAAKGLLNPAMFNLDDKPPARIGGLVPMAPGKAGSGPAHPPRRHRPRPPRFPEPGAGPDRAGRRADRGGGRMGHRRRARHPNLQQRARRGRYLSIR